MEFFVAAFILGFIGLLFFIEYEWHLLWRLAFSLPFVVMALVWVHIGLFTDKHNLWPIEIIFVGGIGALYLLIVIILKSLCNGGAPKSVAPRKQHKVVKVKKSRKTKNPLL